MNSSGKVLVIFLVIILVIAFFTIFFLLKNKEDTSSKKVEEKTGTKQGYGKADTKQEQATTEDLQNKIESAIREKLSKSAS